MKNKKQVAPIINITISSMSSIDENSAKAIIEAVNKYASITHHKIKYKTNEEAALEKLEKENQEFWDFVDKAGKNE